MRTEGGEASCFSSERRCAPSSPPSAKPASFGSPWLEALTATLVLEVAQVVLVSFVLLATAAYQAAALAIATAAVALVSVLLQVALPRGSTFRWRLDWRPPRPRTALEWLTASLLLLVVVHLLVRLALAVRLVPYGYDALAYHLAAVGWMVQDGRIPGPGTGIMVSGYPLNGELLAAWTAALLRDDVLSRVPQVFTAALGGLATAGLARAVGAHRVLSVAAGCLFLLTPALLARRRPRMSTSRRRHCHSQRCVS